MLVESARYLQYGDVEAVIDGVVMVVPPDPGNRHWLALLAWVGEGNVIAPWEPPA